MIPMLIEACPSFQSVLDEHRRYYGEEILYVALGDFARHLLQLHYQQQNAAFPTVAHAIERLHVEGDAYGRADKGAAANRSWNQTSTLQRAKNGR